MGGIFDLPAIAAVFLNEPEQELLIRRHVWMSLPATYMSLGWTFGFQNIGKEHAPLKSVEVRCHRYNNIYF